MVIRTTITDKGLEMIATSIKDGMKRKFPNLLIEVNVTMKE